MKLFLVAKCVNHPVLNALVAEQNLAKTSSQQRPTSPITFATDSRRRPRSPSGEDEGHDSETFSDNDGSADDRDIFDVVEDSVEPNPPDSPVVQTPPSSHFNSPPSRDPSSQPSSLSKRYTQPKHHEPSATAVAAVLSTVAVSPQQKQMEHGIPSSYDPAHLFLIRFATGQLLEDDRSLDSYDIKAHELIEIHRAGVLLRLPRTNIHEYIQPYFEGLSSPGLQFVAHVWSGWVKALRVIYKPTRPTASDLHSTKSVKTQATDPPTTRSSLEWRKRWVVIHDGVFSISKDRAVSRDVMQYICLIPSLPATACTGASTSCPQIPSWRGTSPSLNDHHAIRQAAYSLRQVYHQEEVQVSSHRAWCING